ncbi:hypothetical protein [Denitromonas sp.]|jgi:hypothetical protein|uniref:hypothetical protein n=1 Tax=Denitromonas sp. TaxID=2734609 RepID=UPI002AFE62C5|nr:hypothetical protein [Denitromonas sp.]
MLALARFRRQAPQQPDAAGQTLAAALLYQFKRDVLALVAKLNQGVMHQDCDALKRQTMFVQAQLFHSLYHDPAIPEATKTILMHYHLKSVRATLGDRRGARARTA